MAEVRGAGVLGLAVVGLAAVAVVGAAVALAAAREEEPAPEEPEPAPEEPEPTPEPEPEPLIDATLRTGSAWWAGLTEWVRVHTRWPNEWPADTDITFSWEIRNLGDVGAYFQVYMFDPGEWLYLDPGEDVSVTELHHTPVVPVSPGYEYYRVYILARKVTGERIGAVWTSEEIEVTYV